MQLNLQKLPFVQKKHIPWIIWSIAGLYYFYDFILRMLPGTMTSQLMHFFHVNATGLAVFTASYYWSYTFMQIPAGVIIDRYSIHKTIFASCLFCLFGFVLVHTTHLIHVAEVGRFIIGFGCAFAYIGALKVASIWLPKNRFGLASCVIDSLGTAGAIFTEVALVRLSIKSGYTTTAIILLLIGIAIALIIYFCLHDAPAISDHGKLKEIDTRDRGSIIEKLIRISKNPQIWLIGLVGCLFYLPFSVVGDVWRS
nr:MFS transporter [Gammaproteobacteria bacterium]